MATHRHSSLRRPHLPTGRRRLAARAPILLFSAGLGWMCGRRLLLLHHTGRITGLGRRAILAVVAHDGVNGTWTVASGFGPEADWYRNLRREPKTLIQFGNRHLAVTAHFLTADEGAEIMARQAQRHPRLARRMCALMGLPTDGSTASFRDAGRVIPFVRLDADAGAWSS
ncbi:MULTISPECIES: nitroreductase family deazaflavin-dependent oxidoreductase [unclassified Streptomyces]|uniref:nitroreductase family deazaflavin-dependent oxidoreductase n=1 Tax=unclassified Streptomyces TaxID=2593676 RepID=UPI002740F3A9|nr:MULTISPECIES: nitroreductase family deazaflavin-dependent oxidoreductase [unclassified Streptomyces]